jgi:hypothetical protein
VLAELASDGGARRDDRGSRSRWPSGCARAAAEPAFKGYRGYPATLCASVNDEVVHGIPAQRALADGDIISLDMGVKLDGFLRRLGGDGPRRARSQGKTCNGCCA